MSESGPIDPIGPNCGRQMGCRYLAQLNGYVLQWFNLALFSVIVLSSFLVVNFRAVKLGTPLLRR